MGKEVTIVARRRSRQYEDVYEMEDAIELGDVLEPYANEEWQQEESYMQQEYPAAGYDPYAENDQTYNDDFSEELDEVDHESRFRVAMGMFDFVSIFVGIVVILMLLAMILTLFNWVRSDILHSAVLLQSGLQ